MSCVSVICGKGLLLSLSCLSPILVCLNFCLLLVLSTYLFLLGSITLYQQSDHVFSLQRAHLCLGDVHSVFGCLPTHCIIVTLSEVSLITAVSQHSPLPLHPSLCRWDTCSLYLQLPQCNPSAFWPCFSGKDRPQSCKCSPVPGSRHHNQCANRSGPESLQVKENLTWKIALLLVCVFSVLYFFCNLQSLSPHPVPLPSNFLLKLSPFGLLCSLATNDYFGCWGYDLPSCPAKPYFLQNWESSFLSTELRFIIMITGEYYRPNKLQIAC